MRSYEEYMEENKDQAKEIIGSIPLKNQLQAVFNLNITSIDEGYEKIRLMGRSGWTCGEIPTGGYRLPYDMADKFDFAFIGATEAEIDGEKGLWHQNQFYKSREYEEETKGQKKGKMIKYSRGAKPTDPTHLKEGATGEKPGYITLISFKGNARNIPRLFKNEIQKN